MTLMIWNISIVHFNSHPHEEDDNADRWSCKIDGHFNSHPHEEDDGNKA